MSDDAAASAASIAGLTRIMNPEATMGLTAKELEEIEREVMGRPAAAAAGPAGAPAADPVSQTAINQELDQLISSLGVGLAGAPAPEPAPAVPLPAAAPAPAVPAYVPSVVGSDAGGDDEALFGDAPLWESVQAVPSNRPGFGEVMGRPPPAAYAPPPVAAPLPAAAFVGMQHPAPASAFTQDQQAHTRIQQALGAAGPPGHDPWSLEPQREVTERLQKIEQIAAMRQELVDDGISCENIPEITERTSNPELDAILLTLHSRRNGQMYSTIFEEMMLWGCGVFESHFDGSREVPVVGWQPDYTGISDTMQTKLMQMRRNTSQVVGQAIGAGGMGPGKSLFWALLPAFLYQPFNNKGRRRRGNTRSSLLAIGSQQAEAEAASEFDGI